MLATAALTATPKKKKTKSITPSSASVVDFQRTKPERSHTGCFFSHNKIPTDNGPIIPPPSATYTYLVRNYNMLPSNQLKQQHQQRAQIAGNNTTTTATNNDNKNNATHKHTDNTVLLSTSSTMGGRTRRVSDASNNNNDIAVIPSSLLQQPNTKTPGVATNVILKEDDQARMRTAMEFIEEARDMEQYNYYNIHHHHHRHHRYSNKEIINDDDDDDDDNDVDMIAQHRPQHLHDNHDDEQGDLGMKNKNNDSSSCSSSSSYHHAFQLLQEEKQSELYKRAISIMESIVGYYHPDVSNTYHLFGWSLYELGQGRKTVSALVYLLRALRISQRLFGNDHTSTCVVLDDIRDIVHDEQQYRIVADDRNNKNDNTVLLENHCNRVFDSWVYQNLAEEALLVHNDPVTSIRLYKHALRMLPTEPSMMTTTTNNNNNKSNNDKDENSNDDDQNEMMNTDDDHVDDDDDREIMRDSNGDDDDDDDGDASITVAATIDVDEYNSMDDERICVAELERATIQLHMAAIIQQHQMHFSILSTATDNNDSNESGGSNNNGEEDEEEYESSFNLYCKALAVLPNWLSENNPTVQQARKDVSQVAIDIAIYRYATGGAASGSSATTTTTTSGSNNNSNVQRRRRLNSITNNNDIKLVLR